MQTHSPSARSSADTKIKNRCKNCGRRRILISQDNKKCEKILKKKNFKIKNNHREEEEEEKGNENENKSLLKTVEEVGVKGGLLSTKSTSSVPHTIISSETPKISTSETPPKILTTTNVNSEDMDESNDMICDGGCNNYHFFQR